jgi:toxin ParE1/3/4
MAHILRTPQADADLTEIWSYIARDNPAAADKLIRQIDAAFQLIAENPEIGIRQDEIRPGLYCKPVRRWYLIFYEIGDDAVHVLRVLHGARNYEELFK